MPFSLLPHRPPPRSRPQSPARLPRRRGVVGTLAAVLTAGALGVAGLAVAPPAFAQSTLGQLAATHGRYFGSAVDNSHLSDTTYTSILGSEFTQVTPENSMKWDTTEPQQGQFNFTPGDQIVTYAQQHSQIVRGHNLVWHSQLPGWVTSLPTSQVQAAMENHITQEATHYKGEVYAWDVVNEPFNDDGTFRTDVFYNAMGSGYIADALRTAHAADPNAKLYLNDYNIEGTGAKADAMYNLVSSLKAQGVPIDGVGFETHLAIQYGFPTNMQQNLQRFADLGVDVAITELDVRMQLPRDATKDATQATYFSNVTNACLAVTRCVGITVWEFTDKYSWVPNTFSGEGAADPYDENFQTKPAYTAIANDLGGGGVTDTTPPSAPANLAVSSTTSSSASLTWSASTDDVGVTGYNIYRGSTAVGTTTSTSFTDTGLAASTAYSYTVKAKDAAGNLSAASNVVTATTQAGGGGTGALKVQYKNNDTAPGDNQIKPGMQLVNTGTSAVSLSTVTVRYWFTGEAGASTYSTYCDYAAVGCGNVTSSVSAVSPARTGADHYLQVGFTGGSLAAGASSGDIQNRLNKTDWSAFDETNDYSYGTNTSYADAPKITVYVNGTLVYGTEPS